MKKYTRAISVDRRVAILENRGIREVVREVGANR